MRPRRLLGAAALATLGAALWWRKNPSACPYGQRFWVEAPHPIVTRDRLRSVLRPEPGERILEIGPGTGYYTLDMAEWVGPEGKIEIFDLQQEFLDHTVGPRRPSGASPTSSRPRATPPRSPTRTTRWTPSSSPPSSGRSPTRSPPCARSHRVLKPTGRLIVGELFGDPHFTTQAALKRQAAEAGLAWETHSGNWFAYFARLAPGH